MEEVQTRQRKEKKDLQGRITQKKRNATKRTRKGINDECDSLQRELEQRHQLEIDAVRCQSDRTSDVADAEEERNLKVREIEAPPPNGTADSELKASSSIDLPSTPMPRKPNRQKARLARRAAEQEAQAAQAADEAANLPDRRKQEMTAMQTHIERLGFQEISIRPDGHCMYSAVATLLQDSNSDQGSLDTGGLFPHQAVRAETARFISTHAADFEAFVEDPIDQYTNKIKNTTEWGGQIELQAISRAYGFEINVLQADGRIERIESGTESQSQPIWLSYYRHSFGLGEHYNALRKTA